MAGVVGAELSAKIVLILGLANLLADGFSMAAGNYIGTKAESDEYEHLRRVEEQHIDLMPEGEREEVRQIFQAKGFEGADLERAVEVITSSHERWVETMMAEEHGLARVRRRPMTAATYTFIAFALCGAVPLIPFLFGAGVSLPASMGFTTLAFFAVGSLRSRWSPHPWWRCGLETVAIGLGAAVVAYGVGWALRGIV